MLLKKKLIGNKKLTPEQERVKAWIKENRGVLTEIAVRHECCHQFVHQVAYGTSTTYKAHREIEQSLREKGWPGITRSRSGPGYRDVRITI
jgi:hypothetical protein